MKRMGVVCILLFGVVLSVMSQELVRDSATLSASDELYGDRGRIHWYPVDVKANTRIAVRAVSVDFVPEIVFSRKGEDDGSRQGASGSAGASFTADADTSVRVGIASASADIPFGSYTIRIVSHSVPAALAIGATRSGEIAYDDEVGSDGTLVDWWSLNLKAGERAAVVAQASGFSPYVVAEMPDGTTVVPEQSADGYSVARIAPSSDAAVKVGVSSQNETGVYHLSILVPPEPEAMRTGDTVDGRLDDQDDMLSGQPAQAYRIMGTTGESVRIDLKSDEFDTVLAVQDAAGRVDTNDDVSEDDLNSQLDYLFSADGPLDIRVYGIDAESRGAFTLSVSALEE